MVNGKSMGSKQQLVRQEKVVDSYQRKMVVEQKKLWMCRDLKVIYIYIYADCRYYYLLLPKLVLANALV